MGILEDFAKSIKKQKEQYAEDKTRSIEEKAARENEAMIKAAREKAAKEQAAERSGTGGSVLDRMKEQREQFEEVRKMGTASAQGATQTVQQPTAPDIVTQYGYTFKHSPGEQSHVWFDDPGKAVYIDDVDAFVKEGGKIERRDITAGMDPHMYNIYTKRGGPMGQARYYRPGGMVISLVSDPFVKYR